jgi:hypothetical protein
LLKSGFHLLQARLATQNLCLFVLQVRELHAPLQLGFEQQGQEAAEHMTPNCLIALVVDGPGFEN